MKGRITDFAIGIDGKQRLTVSLDGDFRHQYQELHEKDIDVQIKRFRERRSKDANAYAWVLMDKIAEVMRIGKADVYRSAIREIGGVSEIVCVINDAVEHLINGWSKQGLGWQTDTLPSKIDGCTNVVLYFGSSTYDTKQMSSLIDKLVQDAKALGIETMTPDELEQLEGYANERAGIIRG